MNYLIEFLENNKNKSFITNLQKYNELNFYGKCKCLSSFLTHLFIDAELFFTENPTKFKENILLQEELLSLLNELVLYKNDKFVEWISNKLNSEE